MQSPLIQQPCKTYLPPVLEQVLLAQALENHVLVDTMVVDTVLVYKEEEEEEEEG